VRTLVHLSDLHFGRVRDDVLKPLIESVNDARPDLVAISGDLTMRARRIEFEQAAKFLKSLPSPQLVVPGNHDLPHFNVWQSVSGPLDKYRRYVSQDLEPFYADSEIAVSGINTARPFSFKGGRINRTQVARSLDRISGLPPHVTRIIVTHHPFDLPERYHSRELVGRARMALETFLEAGADVFLAGHMHLTYSGHTAERWKIRDYAALVIQAGTATSTRERDEFNAFNVIRIQQERIEVESISWNGRRFERLRTDCFNRTQQGWRNYAAVQPPSIVITEPVTNAASGEQR
jgi:3',5'-cyclic AMP phosphodiesterase CpdA